MGSCVLWLFVVCWCVGTLWAQIQNSPCVAISSQYVRSNLHYLTVGMANVQELELLDLKPMLIPRVPGTQGSTIAREHIKARMTEAEWTVTEDQFTANTPVGTRTFSNVIATLDPRKPRRIVFACHYDSKLMDNFVGATDSAVPCSLLMDTARRLKHIFQQTKTSNSDLTLQFVFFDGEEAFVWWTSQDSLYGSRHLAELWAQSPDPNSPGRNYIQNIETFILLDLIGTADTTFSLRFLNTRPVYAKFHNIEYCLYQEGMMNYTQQPHLVFSPYTETSTIQDDHIPFLQRGVPVVHLISHPFPQVWHTSADNLHALDFGLIDNLARILRVYMADLPM